MKYLFLAFILCSCSIIPKSIKRYDTTGLSHDGNYVYFESKPIARIQAMTFSLDGTKLVREINLKIMDAQHMDKVPNLIRYIYDLHKTSEIEVELEMIQ